MATSYANLKAQQSKASLKALGLSQTEADDLLRRLNERFRYAKERWQPIHNDGQNCMRFVSGDSWAPEDRRAREASGRFCLTFDETNQYLNQVVNDAKANKQAAKFSPVGDGADDDTAQFYASKWKEIEYRSNAADSYVHGLKDCVERGYGYVRLAAEVQKGHFDQELVIKEIADPDTIFPDPDGRDRALRDIDWLFEVENWQQAEFLRKFPDAEIRSFDRELQTTHADWLGPNRVQVAAYWEVQIHEREVLKLQQLQRGGAVADHYLDELPKKLQRELAGDVKIGTGVKVLARRVEDEKRVCRYLTNGVEILEKNEWAGPWIPYAACFAKVLYMRDGEGDANQRKLQGMVHTMREPQQAFSYQRTTEMELIGRTTKNAFMAVRGQFNENEKREIAKSIHEPVAVLEYAAMVEGVPGVLNPPLPTLYQPQIEAVSKAAEESRRGIQAAAAMGFLPAAAQQRNEKSGKALQQIETAGQRGSYHFIDAYQAMIRFLAEQGEAIMDKIYDTPRDVTVIEADDTPATVRINDPKGGDGSLASVKGKHAVTISTGPDFQSERQEQSAFADTLIGSETVMAAAGPQGSKEIIAKAIRLKGAGPIGDQIAEILDPKEDAESDISPRAKAMLQQAQQMGQAAQQEIQQLQQIVQTKMMERDTELKKTKLEIEGRIKIAGIQAGAKVHDTDTSSQTDIEIQEMRNEIERLRLLVEKREGDKDREADERAAKRQIMVGRVEHAEAEEASLEGS